MLRLILLLGLCCTLLGGCASAPPSWPAVDPLFHDTAFAPPSQPVDPARVLSMSPSMRQFMNDEIVPRTRSGASAHRNLLDAMYARGKLKLAYDTEMTRTASEAFDARAGNCLSLVLMTAAFARELGLSVRFQEVRTPATWSREGDLVLIVGHVNVAVGRTAGQIHPFDGTPDWYTIDFLPGADIERQLTSRIETRRVLSMYLNNKSAEALALGRLDDAYWWARAAVEQDPGFAAALNTLGVVYLRRNLLPQAEAALRRMLQVDEDSPHAMGNLAQVLRRQGREAEAAELTLRAERVAPASPFVAYDLGRQALERGDLDLARRQFERALRQGGDYHEFHFGLAQVLARQGYTRAAARELEAAREASSTPRLHAIYSGKLERLRDRIEAPAPPLMQRSR